MDRESIREYASRQNERYVEAGEGKDFARGGCGDRVPQDSKYVHLLSESDAHLRHRVAVEGEVQR